MMSTLPLTLDAKALARLLSPIIYKSESTILRDVSRRPESLPPFEELGGVDGKKIYETQVVIDFYPPGVGASIRRALEREWETKEGKRKGAPPPLQSLVDILLVSAGRV